MKEDLKLEVKNYVVEQLEHGQWVPKMRCNFEDNNFPLIAKQPTYRIMCNGIDVTQNYAEGNYRSIQNINTNVAPPMKPAQYKNLSYEEKLDLKLKAETLKELKKKRSEILIELNITESTYDTMRADLIIKKPDDSVVPVQDTSPKSEVGSSTSNVGTTSRKVGLLGRR